MAIVERERPAEKPAELSIDGEIYMEAARVLREEGWTHGSWRDYKGYCAIGAIQQGAMRTGLAFRYATAVEKFAAQVGGTVSGWNDTPGRKKEEVIEALERAAHGV